MSIGRRILIIEEDIQYGEFLKKRIKHLDYQVYLVDSSSQAINTIKEKKLDLIISEFNISDMNGIQLANKLANMYLDIPFILLTEESDSHLIRHALALGVSDYLVKPIKTYDLPIAIEKSIERKRIEYQKLQKNRADILLKALRALMRALDAKDSYTCGHSQRVVSLAMLMADELQLNTDQRYHLQLAAFLHDIGKIGIPDSILNKVEGLEDYEFRIAKDHPVIGSQIIGEIEELSEVASVVRHHHERYDGDGYPDGLQGEAIPLFARILSIIDSYEALVSDRVYRKGIDRHHALLEIKRNAGTQFDAKLVDVFLRVIEKEKNDHAFRDSKNSILTFSPQITIQLSNSSYQSNLK